MQNMMKTKLNQAYLLKRHIVLVGLSTKNKRTYKHDQIWDNSQQAED